MILSNRIFRRYITNSGFMIGRCHAEAKSLSEDFKASPSRIAYSFKDKSTLKITPEAVQSINADGTVVLEHIFDGEQ